MLLLGRNEPVTQVYALLPSLLSTVAPTPSQASLALACTPVWALTSHGTRSPWEATLGLPCSPTGSGTARTCESFPQVLPSRTVPRTVPRVPGRCSTGPAPHGLIVLRGHSLFLSQGVPTVSLLGHCVFFQEPPTGPTSTNSQFSLPPLAPDEATWGCSALRGQHPPSHKPDTLVRLLTAFQDAPSLRGWVSTLRAKLLLLGPHPTLTTSE